ncbi:MAG TPA: hypothetical protein VF844_16540, partial [Ktedonobacteraceae bacterium]
VFGEKLKRLYRYAGDLLPAFCRFLQLDDGATFCPVDFDPLWSETVGQAQGLVLEVGAGGVSFLPLICCRHLTFCRSSVISEQMFHSYR